MTNTDSPLDELINILNLKIEKIEWTTGATSYQLEDSAKQAIELYCHKQVIEELESLTRIYDGQIKASVMLDLKDRIAELRKTL